MKTKIQDIKNGAVIEVVKELANDYVGTGRYIYYVENKVKPIKRYRKEPKNEMGLQDN